MTICSNICCGTKDVGGTKNEAIKGGTKEVSIAGDSTRGLEQKLEDSTKGIKQGLDGSDTINKNCTTASKRMETKSWKRNDS